MHDRCRNWPCQFEDRHIGPCSTDTSGRCACVSKDARWCYSIRYAVDPADDDLDDRRCECRCHIDDEDSHHE